MSTTQLKEITYYCKADASMQPALLRAADGSEPRPLAVCLHTWSFGIEPPYDHFVERCRERNWHFIFPLFRGPNWNPEGCGSDLVVSDLEDAVIYMKEHFCVDEQRIYLVGGSGGGHASLLMAGRTPELWSAVSAWCPISDIAAWCAQVAEAKRHRSVGDYDLHIINACGGDPARNPKAQKQAIHRSPLTWLPHAKGNVILDIGTGIHDGHTGSVPVSHAIEAFNAAAEPEDRVSQEDIRYMAETEKIPEHLRFCGEDPAYGPHKVLFRRTSGMVRLTIFEGGHDLLPGPAFGFLQNQERGKAPLWNSGNTYDVKAAELTK